MNYGGEYLRVHEVCKRLRKAAASWVDGWTRQEALVSSYMCGAMQSDRILPPPEEPGWRCEGCDCEVWRDLGPHKCFQCLEEEEEVS